MNSIWKKATASTPDHNYQVQLRSNAKVATCRGRLLVSDQQHMDLKLHKDRHIQPLCWCIYSAEEEEMGGRNTPGVTQNSIHAGKIDDGARGAAGMMKPLTATNPYQCTDDNCSIALCFQNLSSWKWNLQSGKPCEAPLYVNSRNASYPCELQVNT